MVLCAKLGFNFTVVCPPDYKPNQDVLTKCSEIAQKTSCSVSVSHNIYDAVKNATVLYTDVWTSMGQEDETELRKNKFSPFQVNKDILSRAPSDVLVSHCLPAHRGEEITSDVLDSERSIAFDEAENRLHVQKAIIVHLFSHVVS
jgi:ornithine carbamoyltransferase